MTRKKGKETLFSSDETDTEQEVKKSPEQLLRGLTESTTEYVIEWQTPQQDNVEQDKPGQEEENDSHPVQRGQKIIRDIAQTLPTTPGVYRMLDGEGNALYVGKAKNLGRRVISYTRQLPFRLQQMVAQTRAMEIVQTKTEAEALLLESNLIKQLKPRYNVLLRDDKSFPYILLTRDHDAPMVTKHRGKQTRPGSYFGPFADTRSVNKTITALERAFLLRSCSDSTYAQRTRPCLMYQIKRCSAPCVGRITTENYNALVAEAAAFLQGRSNAFQQKLATDMQQAAEALDYEKAALYRDRLRALRTVQARQDINVDALNNGDLFALYEDSGQSCIQVFFFRAGRNYGNRSYLPRHDSSFDSETVLTSFIAQFYTNKPVPELVLTSHDLPEHALLGEALSQKAGQKISVLCPKRGPRKMLMDNARHNAREALSRRLAERASQKRLLSGLQDLLNLDKPPERIEVYDNSHTMGDNAYGAMIVAGTDGFIKKAYRKFKIKHNPQAGDDYAMMREVLTRRLSGSLREDPERTGDHWPDLLILDGGAGQLGVGFEVLKELSLTDIPIIAVAKGPDRNAGRERIFLPARSPFLLPPRDPVLYFIQRLRDEAHRFAITTHRKGHRTARLKSTLDSIPGIGAKRKKALLHHFGSANSVTEASSEELESVPGISRNIALKIHNFFNTV